MISKEKLKNCLLNADIPEEYVKLFLNNVSDNFLNNGKQEEIIKVLNILKREELLEDVLEKSTYVLAIR